MTPINGYARLVSCGIPCFAFLFFIIPSVKEKEKGKERETRNMKPGPSIECLPDIVLGGHCVPDRSFPSLSIDRVNTMLSAQGKTISVRANTNES